MRLHVDLQCHGVDEGPIELQSLQKNLVCCLSAIIFGWPCGDRINRRPCIEGNLETPMGDAISMRIWKAADRDLIALRANIGVALLAFYLIILHVYG